MRARSSSRVSLTSLSRALFFSCFSLFLTTFLSHTLTVHIPVLLLSLFGLHSIILCMPSVCAFSLHFRARASYHSLLFTEREGGSGCRARLVWFDGLRHLTCCSLIIQSGYSERRYRFCTGFGVGLEKGKERRFRRAMDGCDGNFVCGGWESDGREGNQVRERVCKRYHAGMAGVCVCERDTYWSVCVRGFRTEGEKGGLRSLFHSLSQTFFATKQCSSTSLILEHYTLAFSIVSLILFLLSLFLCNSPVRLPLLTSFFSHSHCNLCFVTLHSTALDALVLSRATMQIHVIDRDKRLLCT